MPQHRIDRISADIKIALAEMLREIKDPRVSKLLSIVKLNVSGDLSYATVYVSAIEGEEATKQSVIGLKNAAGYLRRQLGKTLSLRKVPELRFVADNSIAICADISQVITSFKKSDEADSADIQEEANENE